MLLRRPAARGLVAALATGCGGAYSRPEAAPVLPFVIDSSRTQIIHPGARYRYLHAPLGPWAIHLLQVDLDRCYSVVAVKGRGGAVGREKTSRLLQDLARSRAVVGGVNADFFRFAPPGVPAGALISQGRVITGPASQPVLAIDSSGRARIAVIRVSGSVAAGGRRFPLEGWNRPGVSGPGWYDAGWGGITDSASGTVEVVLEGRDPARVLRVDTLPAGVPIPADGAVLVAGPAVPAETRAALRGLRPDDTVRLRGRLTPFHPLEAVGGRPLLLRDNSVVPDLDAAGPPGFAAGRHPRTAVGLTRGGRQLLLVAVDGRQKPFSDGMTLRELATLLRALGAQEALNLDGGGSTTLVYADPDSNHALRVANRPSDPTGERPVGDALAIVQGCRNGPASFRRDPIRIDERHQ